MTRLRGWGAEGRAPRRQGSSRPLEDRNFPRRPAQRPHRSALPVRWAHQRRALPRLCRTVPRPDAEAGRRRDPRQFSAPTRERRCARRSGMSEPASSFLPKYSPDLNPIEQVFAKFKTLLRKRRSAQLRGDLRRLRQNPCPVPARRVRRIPQQCRIRVDPKAGRLSYDFSRR